MIDGAWLPASRGARFAVDNPATGEVVAYVADSETADAVKAVEAAAERLTSFARTSASERSNLLLSAYRLLLERAEEFAKLITLEMGKPLTEAYGEVSYAADYLQWFAGEALRLDGTVRQLPDGSGQMVVTREPVGVCVLVTPWNFPLTMAARKIAPALAAGCTAVLKPAPQAPLTALAFAQLLGDAGAPGGIVNVVPTSRSAAVVEALLSQHHTRKISFTGSTSIGKLLLSKSARRVLRTSMELGGNAPFIVFDDADLTAAVDGAIVAKLRNAGQACTAANRFLVHSSVAGEFSERLASRFASVRVGPGIEPDTEVGPLVSDAAAARVSRLVSDARAKGAEMLAGGDAAEGRFIKPTVLTGVSADAQLQREEIFGPVAPISTFDDEDEALCRANDSDYGLVSYVYTRDVGRVNRATAALQSGMVAINRGVVSSASIPFGGIKASGIGREGGNEGIDEYLQLKYAALDAA